MNLLHAFRTVGRAPPGATGTQRAAEARAVQLLHDTARKAANGLQTHGGGLAYEVEAAGIVVGRLWNAGPRGDRDREITADGHVWNYLRAALAKTMISLAKRDNRPIVYGVKVTELDDARHVAGGFGHSSGDDTAADLRSSQMEVVVQARKWLWDHIVPAVVAKKERSTSGSGREFAEHIEMLKELVFEEGEIREFARRRVAADPPKLLTAAIAKRMTDKGVAFSRQTLAALAQAGVRCVPPDLANVKVLEPKPGVALPASDLIWPLFLDAATDVHRTALDTRFYNYRGAINKEIKAAEARGDWTQSQTEMIRQIVRHELKLKQDD